MCESGNSLPVEMGRMMKTREMKVQCEGGLHLRVAAAIVTAVRSRKSEVFMKCAGCSRANACSVMELLKLGAARGTPMEVTVEGPDEDTILEVLAGIFESGGGI